MPKKEAFLSHINKEYFAGHSHIKIRVEMDGMWSFYHNKSHQIWLWWAIDHDTDEVIAYWFGTREHKIGQVEGVACSLDDGHCVLGWQLRLL